MIKIGIVDDHAIVRAGLKQFLSEQVDLRVEGEAGNGREAIDLVRSGVTWTLGANFERLVLTGTAAVDGTGVRASVGAAVDVASPR